MIFALGGGLSQKFDALGVHIGVGDDDDTSDIAARPREALDEAMLDGKARERHNDGDRLRCIFCGPDGRVARRHDYLDLRCDKFGREGWEPVDAALRESRFQNEALPLHVAEIGQCRFQVGKGRGSISDMEEANAV